MTTDMRANILDESFTKAFDFGRQEVKKVSPLQDPYCPETDKTGTEEDSNPTVILRDWASETSAHGCAHVASKSRSFPSRLAWALAVSFMLGGLVFTLYTMLKSYDQYPVNTVTKVQVRPDLPFPGLTICNINDVDLDLISMDKEQFKYFKVHTQWGAPFNYSDPDLQDTLHTPIDTVVNASWISTTHFFSGCSINGRFVESCGELFTFIQTSKSKCAVLNTSHPSLQSMSFAGPQSGLQIYMNIHQEGYVLGESSSAGVQIFVHEPGRQANLHSSGIVLGPGKSSFIALRPTEYKFLPAPYKAYGDEACVDMDDPANHRKLRLAEKYTFEACVLECAVRIVADLCGCNGVLNDLENSTLPICDVLGFYTCYEKKLTQVYFNVTAGNTCECPRPCVFTTYKTQISTALFPSEVTSQLLKEMKILPESDDSGRLNYLDVRIYLDQILHEEVVHEPVYTLNFILGTVGGQMGVFLGASFLTVAELLELIFTAISRALSRITIAKKRVGQTKIVQVQPLKPATTG